MEIQNTHEYLLNCGGGSVYLKANETFTFLHFYMKTRRRERTREFSAELFEDQC